jgi:hypothetical protein
MVIASHDYSGSRFWKCSGGRLRQYGLRCAKSCKLAQVGARPSGTTIPMVSHEMASSVGIWRGKDARRRWYDVDGGHVFQGAVVLSKCFVDNLCVFPELRAGEPQCNSILLYCNQHRASIILPIFAGTVNQVSVCHQGTQGEVMLAELDLKRRNLRSLSPRCCARHEGKFGAQGLCP